MSEVDYAKAVNNISALIHSAANQQKYGEVAVATSLLLIARLLHDMETTIFKK